MIPFILVGSFLAFTAVSFITKKSLFGSPRDRGKYALSIMLTMTGISHFTNTEQFLAMIPPFFPFPLAIVIGSGIIELAFAAALLTKKYVATIGLLLALFLLAVFPANIFNAINGNEVVGGLDAIPYYLWIRLLLQPFYIWWAIWSTRVSITVRNEQLQA